MSQTQTISLEKDFISALKELNTIEQDQLKIYSALFTNSCQALKDKKMDSLSENIYGQIKFYGKNPNKYTKKINNIMSEYSNLMEQILNLYITKFIAIINELQNVYNNQKISITNCKLALDKKNEVKLSASEYKIDNYELLIQECKRQLIECKEDMEKDMNNLFYTKGITLAVKKTPFFQKFFNLFNGNKKIANNVFAPMSIKISSLNNSVVSQAKVIDDKTLHDISIIEDGIIKAKEIFSNMLKEYGYNG